MKHLRPSDYRIMPWKNGGGLTTEIAVFPDRLESGQPFLWRLSIADVTADGPFSRFEGYDRYIAVIAGGGMMLDCGPHGVIDLSVLFRPQSFPGEWDVNGRLVDGPVRDFNLIVSREHAVSSLEVEQVSASKSYQADAATLALHVLAGDAIADGRIVAEGDTLVLEGLETIRLNPSAGSMILALARIHRR